MLITFFKMPLGFFFRLDFFGFLSLFFTMLSSSLSLCFFFESLECFDFANSISFVSKIDKMISKMKDNIILTLPTHQSTHDF